MDPTSIVIVTCNQLEYTRRCLASIFARTSERYELVVVDNGSSDGTVEYLKEVASVAEVVGEEKGEVSGERSAVNGEKPKRNPPIGLIVAVNAENRGFPPAANQGIQAASGQQILLLNNDTIVTAGWLTRMLRALHSDPQIGMVGPCSNFVSGPQQIDVPYIRQVSRAEGRGPVGLDECDLEKLEEFARGWGETNDGQVQQVDRLVGFCLLIRREVVEKIGLFDERFGIGNFEDDDYCRRARDAGFRLMIARDAFVHHFGGATFRSSGIDFGGLLQQNERLYREKWGQEIQRSDSKFQISEISDLRPQKSQHSDVTVSLCMIARDNERTIGAAIESVRQYVGDIVVVDTGSKDKTPEIAAGLGARVFHSPWCDDFSAARNESIRHAIGQWIFWLDTDDTMDAENGRKFQALVQHIKSHPPPKETAGFLMKVRCPGSGLNGRHGVIHVDHVKLFRNLPEFRFEFRIHEQILMSIRRAGGKVAWIDIYIDHSGSDQSPAGRAKKLERDLRILGLEYQERPDHPFVLFNLGMTHDQARNYEQAIGFLWQSIGRSGDDDSHLRKAYAILVSSYRQLGRTVTAWETCVKGLRQYGDDLELRFQQAQLYHALGRRAEAARAYEELRAMQTSRHLSSVDPSLQGYRSGHNLASIYAELGEFSRAENVWRQVVAESAWFLPAWQGLVNLLSQQGRSDDALRCSEQLKLQPEMARDADRLRRSVLVSRGDVQIARDEVTRAIDEHPGDVDLLEERCRLLFEHFPAADAEAGFRELLDHDPDNAAGHHNLGSIQYKLGQFDEAASAYRRSLEFRPNSASTQLHLGYALREAGKIDDAVAAWRHALDIQPGEPLATAALEAANQPC